MTRTIREWLGHKWRRRLDPNLGQAYQATFGTLEGRVVLQHLLDEVYCTVCLSKDPTDIITHNGRRSVIQEMLENIDLASQPDKYIPSEEVNHV